MKIKKIFAKSRSIFGIKNKKSLFFLVFLMLGFGFFENYTKAMDCYLLCGDDDSDCITECQNDSGYGDWSNNTSGETSTTTSTQSQPSDSSIFTNDCYSLCNEEESCVKECIAGNGGIDSWDENGNIDKYDTNYNNFDTQQNCTNNGGYWYKNNCYTNRECDGGFLSCSVGNTCENGVCVTSWVGSTFGIGQDSSTKTTKTTKTKEEIAAAQKAASALSTKITATQSSAKTQQDKITGLKEVVTTACASGISSEACITAQKALDSAADALAATQAELNSLTSQYNEKLAEAGIDSQMSSGGSSTGGYSSGNTNSSAKSNSGVGSSSGGSATGSYPVSLDCGVNFKKVGGVCFPAGTGLSEVPVTVILSNIFSWLMGLFTTLAVLAFVVSGIQYMLAAGDESLAESAKENAKNALIGIIIGLSGFIVVKAIAAALSGQGYFF